MRIALAQVNAKVGDISGNAGEVRARVAEAAARGVQLAAFPEMMLTGYPVEDLALRPSFQRASAAAAEQLARDIDADGNGEVICVVGYLAFDTSPVNAVAVMHRGSVVATYVKHHLPNYGVFDEARYFRSGSEPLLLRIDDVTVSLAICEDLWQEGGPVEWARDAQAGLLLVVNASPYERGKDDSRLALCRLRALEAGCSLAYVNLVGAQDELVFDGDSIIVSPGGDVIARAPQFQPVLMVADIEVPTSPAPAASVAMTSGAWPAAIVERPGVSARMPELEEVYFALVLGLAGYVGKNGFRSVILGLSGGIDSALVAAIACDAIGADRVFGVSMPSVYSSAHSKDDAHDLARRCGLSIRTVAITPMVEAFLESLTLTGLAEENLQARVRGITLMGISNQEGHLVLTTGNKSELSVGYSTLYGDSAGGFGPIKDVSKTLVWELSRWRNAFAEEQGKTPPIPPSSIDKPPSAELRPGQVDSDSLPDYAVLDAILEGYVSGDQGAAALVAAGFDQTLVERVLRMTDAAEYKRRQFPPGTKISLRAFGRDRRLPITNGWRESAG
jgi:NAD+ synthase (glutamine-hydrolysing)